jgi:hypothetical protein
MSLNVVLVARADCLGDESMRGGVNCWEPGAVNERNTIFDVGHRMIDMGKLRSGLFRYNDFSHRGPQVTDFGCIHAASIDGEGTRIGYNQIPAPRTAAGDADSNCSACGSHLRLSRFEGGHQLGEHPYQLLEEILISFTGFPCFGPRARCFREQSNYAHPLSDRRRQPCCVFCHRGTRNG